MPSTAISFDRVWKTYTLRHETGGGAHGRGMPALSRLLSFRGRARSSVESFHALRDVSFEIKQGEAVGIIGPNGSGKSTALKILAGVTRPSRGAARVFGKLGALIEVGAGFHPELTGRENVYLNGSILGMKKAAIRACFDSIVDFAELEQFIDTPIKHYSSGMYVRLGFSIAIHNVPDIMLVDEVLAVGDLEFQRKCFSKMQEIKERGATFILVSHAMGQIEAVCERAIMLRKGSLVADGPVTEVTRLYEETSAKAPTAEPKSRKVSILDLRLLDAQGSPTSRSAIGMPLCFEVDYLAHEPVRRPTFSYGVWRNGTPVVGGNSRILGIDTGVLEGRGRIRYTLHDLALMPGHFDAAFAIRDAGEKEELATLSKPGLFTIATPSDLTRLGANVDPLDLRRLPILYGNVEFAVIAESEGRAPLPAEPASTGAPAEERTLADGQA